MADKCRGDWSLITCLKNLRTPLFAPAPLRISLITLVSIKYTRHSASILNPLEISVLPDVRHACQHFRQAALFWAAKRLSKNFAMFGFGAPTVSGGAVAQALDQRF